MVERRGIDGLRFRQEGLAQGFDEFEEGRSVKGEGGATASVGRRWVGHGGQLGTREVVAIHGYKGRYGCGDTARCLVGVDVIKTPGNEAGESGLACKRVRIVIRLRAAIIT